GPRRDVDLQVELAKLACPARVGDRAEHLGVLHRRQAVLVHQVELDLQPHLAGLAVEPGLPQHPREDVQAAADLLPVGTPVLLAYADRWDIPAQSDPSHMPGAGQPALPQLSHVTGRLTRSGFTAARPSRSAARRGRSGSG